MDLIYNRINAIKQWRSRESYRNFKTCLSNYKVEFIFLIYNIGDALLDAILRPNVPQIVCFSMYQQTISSCQHMEKHGDLQNNVQRQASTYLILHKLLTNLPALTLGMICGAFSDKYGRKIPMVMPSLGTNLAVLLYMGANMTYKGSVACFLAGSIVHGCFGKTAMVSMAVNSYVVDITSLERRTKTLGTLASMQFIGMFLGSLFGGFMLSKTDVLTSYCCVSVINAFIVVVILYVLKETVNVRDRSQLFPFRACCSASNVKESLQVIFKPRPGKTRCCIFGLFAVLILHQTCRTGLTDVTLLFTERSPFLWPTAWFGYLSALDNAAMGLILLVVLPILSNFLKFSDPIISSIGLLCACVRFLIMAWSDQSWMVWLSVVIGSVGGIINSPIRSLLSKLVDENEVGKMFSLLGSGETMAKFLAVIFTYLYGSTFDIFSGLAFLLAAALYFIMIVIVLIVQIMIKNCAETQRILEKYTDHNNHAVDDACKIEMNQMFDNGQISKNVRNNE